jgi:hypothetical protein
MRAVIDESHIEALTNVQNSLVQTLVEATAINPEVAAWDKVSWGRKSSSIDHLGRPDVFSDVIEVANDARLQQKIQEPMAEM